MARNALGSLLPALQHTANPVLHSPAWLPCRLDRELNAFDADLLHLHWVQGEMLSIEAIGRLHKPLVWTLHDGWAFCGSEHYPDGAEDRRYQQGYHRGNRPPNHHGLDLDRWCWQRKRRHWKRPMQLVCPSRWLASCVERSALLRDWPVRVIPHPLPTDLYRPWPQALARQLFALPAEAPLLLFGAIGGSRDPRKGWDLLAPALQQLAHTQPSLQVVVFGQSEPADPPRLGLPIHYVGALHDNQALALLYSSADVMVVPSRMEALGQTASEAQACGVPVVAFNATGLPDVVEHLRTGYLAAPFDPTDLAAGIRWVLEDDERRSKLGAMARSRAAQLWQPAGIARQYLEVYEQARDAWNG
ncbi:glycosyltransferase [Cyanobium sp. NIES-981]|uniref:glycosyltransferase n=1 Tax=Cyanobium sp. NIES-981 TaxID=1851505 RepID=UPI000B350112|nr:glycosyltransferase [Cyanobium sp. NIES-981]